MPDLITIFNRWWKFILSATLLAVVIAGIAALLSPKEYESVATALPANAALADKARIFNQNIHELYSDFGSPDELDRIVGTSVLDTVFIALTNEFDLVAHYQLKISKNATHEAVKKLKENSRISKTAYGELSVRVWDKDRNLAAALANNLLKKLQELHQHLQNENTTSILKNLKNDYLLKQQEYRQTNDLLSRFSKTDTAIIRTQNAAMLTQLQEYKKLIGEYELALAIDPQVLLLVEPARPSVWPSKPKVLQTILFTLFAAFACFFLVALFLESRNQKV